MSYTSDTDLAQDKVNRSFGPWHDPENKVISHELKVPEVAIETFGEPYKRLKTVIAKNKISRFKNVAYSTQKPTWGWHPFPMC